MADDRMAALELLRKAAGDGDFDFLREGLAMLSQLVMDAEVSTQIEATHGERVPERRLTQRIGYRERRWDTRVGMIDLRIPKLRDGTYFPSLLEPRRRAERALLAVVQEAYVGGVSTRRVEELVERCDLMLVSHGHADHFGDALMIASRTRPAWPCIHEMSLWLSRNCAHKDGLLGMNKGGTVEAAGLKVTMVRADHSGGDIYAGAESPIYLGEPVGYVVELESGFRFYFAGDTDVFGDMRLIGERFRPTLAFLPIGGHFTMDPTAAALAVELLGVKHVLPMHWGTFPVLAGTPAQLRNELTSRGMGGVEVYEIRPGESVS